VDFNEILELLFYLSDKQYHAKFCWFLLKWYPNDLKYLDVGMMKISPLYQNPIFRRQFELHVGWDAKDNEINKSRMSIGPLKTYEKEILMSIKTKKARLSIIEQHKLKVEEAKKTKIRRSSILDIEPKKPEITVVEKKII